MIGLPDAYLLAGLLFAGFAAASLRAAQGSGGRRRAVFLGLIAMSFLFGDRLGDLGNGVVVVALALLALMGVGSSGRAPDPAEAARSAAGAARHRDRLFALALIVPVVALGSTLLLGRALPGGLHLVDPKQVTVVGLALGVVAALAVALPVLHASPLEPLAAGERLTAAIGWAIVLPQMLAALGAVFALSGVGQAVADLATRLIAPDDRLAVVCVYTGGMALFTMVMGNAFAAFPVMTAGVGLPLIVRRLHGDPAVMGSLGMLSGFCGTLLTPMAANFNIVPTALLDLDRWAVIRAQAPTAVLMLAVNTLLMYLLVFRF